MPPSMPQLIIELAAEAVHPDGNEEDAVKSLYSSDDWRPLFAAQPAVRYVSSGPGTC